MSETKQTAVEWLIEQIMARQLYTKEMLEEFEQAKEMEKNQHRSTADIFESDGFERCYYHSNHGSLNFEKWYNETYGGKNELV
jgi:hypothetical protein